MTTNETTDKATNEAASDAANREAESPEPTEEEIAEAMKKVEGINDRYDSPDRKTVVLPGSDGTISGTAINDWLDDDGNAVDHSKDGE